MRKRVLVAGATGYLGRYILIELKKRGYYTIALVRDPAKIPDFKECIDETIVAEVTQPETMIGVCRDVDCVISTLGITRQKDGLTYTDVDYKANSNLLDEAQKSGVKKFIYVSVLNAHLMKNLKIIEAKERFVDELINSGMDYSIIRPNGFFSDMEELLTMAIKGTVYLFGDGSFKANPIHGEDLAEVCVNAIEDAKLEVNIGGPELLTQDQMAQYAFDALNREPKIKHIPLWVKTLTLHMVRFFTSSKTYGPIEFFLTVLSMDMIAEQYGTHMLKDYYSKSVFKI